MRCPHPVAALSATVTVLLGLAACGSGEGDLGDRADGPQIVVTTTVLGDVVSRLVGNHAEVEVLMPRGADPHDVQISARQAADLRSADALVVNGAGLEAGYLAAIEAAEADGVPTYAAIDAVATMTFEEGQGHEGEDGHAGGDGHAEGADHHHEGVDPHFFTDPDRMADAADGITAFLVDAVAELDTDAFRATAAEEVAALRALAADVEEILAPIPAEDRVLVTNHQVFGYLADRYGFEVVGTVVPGGGTGAEPGAGELTELVDLIEDEGVPAIFVDVSSPARLAQALAEEVGQVEVVALFTESLGDAGSGAATYGEMVRTNAERIVAALT